jgi:hypothetical protein
MKKVRLFSVVLAAALFVAALVPFVAAPVAAANTQSAFNAAISSPAQAFADATRGLPLLAPMSLAAPLISVSTESNASSSGYGCTLVRQTPLDWTKMRSRQYFDAAWTVVNSGNAVWHMSATKLEYVGGAKMQTHGDEIGLSNDVGRGKKIKLVVDMNAPKALGTYSTLWALFSGNTRFCKVTLTITVVR